jgi:uncharacterized protein (DUF169 family)
MDQKQAAEVLNRELRLRTEPIGVKFLKDKGEFPGKTRRPLETLGKKITICQGVTLARTYKWTVGLAKEDLICVPAMIAFGFTKSSRQAESLGKLFCEVSFHQDQEHAEMETQHMSFLGSGEYGGILLAPLSKGLFDPDIIAVYGNPAQINRLIQAWAYHGGARIPAAYGGKVECSDYLIGPFKHGGPRVSIPGQGDRIFSMTQDDELVFSLPGNALEPLLKGLEEAGKKIGARYPITFYQNFQPEFPKMYNKIGKEVGAIEEE